MYFLFLQGCPPLLHPGRGEGQWEQGHLCQDGSDQSRPSARSPQPPRGGGGGEPVPQVHCQPATGGQVLRGSGEVQCQRQLQWTQPCRLTRGGCSGS